MTNRSNVDVFALVLLLGLISSDVLAFPAQLDAKDEAITLPGGQKVRECDRIAKQDISHIYMCFDLERMPLLLTISSVNKLGDSSSLNAAQQGKHRLSLPASRRVPFFLQSCRPKESKNNIDEFVCVNGHKSLHVGVRNHLSRAFKWVEVMVDGSGAEGEGVPQRDAKNAKAAKNDKREPPTDRADCTDENDPACDLEDVRSGDN